MSKIVSDIPLSLVWFRRDLRSFDHAALYHALRQSEAVVGVFIFDKAILDHLPANDRRVKFIYDSVLELQQSLEQLGGGLIIRYGDAATEIPQLAAELKIHAVFVNHDYEPAAIARDHQVASALHKMYFWPGMSWRRKLHFKPVGNPAPPRPRNADNFKASTISACGVFSFRIFKSIFLLNSNEIIIASLFLSFILLSFNFLKKLLNFIC